MSMRINRLLFWAVTALMLLVAHCDDTPCEKGFYGETCREKCEESCNVEKENCNKSTGVCPFCKDGFYSKDSRCISCSSDCKLTCTREGCDECKEVDAYDAWCTQKCEHCAPHEVRSCDKQDGRCLGNCKLGYYNPKCSAKCPENCDLTKENCLKDTGNCPQCLDGFYGNLCEKCPATCSKCLSDTNCTQCTRRDFYGSICDKQCPSECADEGKDSICSLAEGACFKCKEGRYGKQCETQCPPNCLECEKDTGLCLRCKTKFYLDSGKCFECMSQCATCNDKDTCTSCVDNKYEAKCEKDCPADCSYPDKEHCDFKEGSCKECKKNHEGKFCEKCSKGMWGDCFHKCEIGCDTTSVNCDKKTGNCDNCYPLYWGVKCEYTSKTPNCKRCDGKGTCVECNDKYYLTKEKECKQCPDTCAEETCTEEEGCKTCKLGYFGLMCTEKCPLHCKGSMCDKQTGKCECEEFFEGDKCDSCIKGRTGEDCKGTCGEHCDITEKNCNRDGECDKCLEGYFGRSCGNACPSNCLGEPDVKCDKNSGYCVKCKNGFWGNKCEDSCKTNCEQCNKEDGKCKKCKATFYLVTEKNECEQCPVSCANQECNESDGCAKCKTDGTYGKFCESQCPVNCEKKEELPLCARDSGNCEKCKANFSGFKCDMCIEGKYGASCEKACGNCTGKECNKDTGECSPCIRDFWGEMCTKQCGEKCDTDKVNCIQDNGHCTACIYGYYSHECIACPSNCELECDMQSGDCAKCKAKRWGSKCEAECPSQCEGNCFKDSGDCERCLEGYYGDKCNETCGGCLKGCSKSRGECEKHECRNSFFNPWFCNQKCSPSCFEGQCDLFTGFCKACKGKKWGKACEKEWRFDCDKDFRVECNEAKEINSPQLSMTISNGSKQNGMQKDSFPILKVAFGSQKVKLNLLVDFDSNSPLVVFDNTKDLRLSEQSHKLIALYNSTDSETEFFLSYNKNPQYDLFETIEGDLYEELLFLKFSQEKEQKIKVRFINPHTVKYKPVAPKLSTEVNGIIGLGFLSSFSQDLINEEVITKNVLIITDTSVSFGDYTKDIKAQYSTMSTLIPTEAFKYNSNNSIKALIRGFTSNYGKGYKVSIDTTLSYSKQTEIFFPNSLQSYFEKLYFGSFFTSGVCEVKDKGKSIKEYSCNDNLKFDSLPLIGLVIDDYIYYLTQSHLFEKEGEKYAFKIKLNKEPKIVLGKEFFSKHYSLIYNQGNGTVSLFGNTKKLFLELVDIPKEWPDLSNTGWFTPGTIALLVIFGMLAVFIVVYISSYYMKKKKKYFEMNDNEFKGLIG